MDYQRLIADAVEEPAAAFGVALRAEDPTAIALVSIVDPSSDASMAVERLKSFVAHHGLTVATTEALLGIFEQSGRLPEEVSAEAKSIISRGKELPPVDVRHAERIRALVLDRDAPEPHRTRLLFWLWQKRAGVAKRIAQILLSDPDEGYSHVARQAIYVVASQRGTRPRTVLARYADRHLEVDTPEGDGPPREVEAALFVINAIRKPGDDDLDLIARVLAATAQRGLALGETVNGLLQRLTMQHIACLVQHLAEQGYQNWVAEQLLPALIAARAGDIARVASADWWPQECLPVFTQTKWADGLCPVILEQLHRTGDQAACAAIRQRVAQRCQSSQSTARGDMPRIGARALLKLGLAGTIDTTDASLLAALGALDEDSLSEEITNANWKRPERAHAVGEIVGHVKPALLGGVVSHALRQGSATAAPLIAGASAEALEANLDDVQVVVANDEAALAALCRKSAAAAQAALQAWQEEHDMISFRALASTPQAEERVTTIPAAVRSYGHLTTAERRELLEAYGPTGQRPEVLCGILDDRRNPPDNQPTEEDLIEALDLLGEHLGGGLAPELVLDHMSLICTEARKPRVRQAACAALGNAAPTSQVVDLLLSRRSGERGTVRPAVVAALGRIADKLDERAAAAAGNERRDAVAQLARIDPPRAVDHARRLLPLEPAADRITAATIIGECGNEDDVSALEAILEDEGHEEVQRELQQAIRRLRIGDSDAAHRRLAELAGLADVEAWVTLDPQKAYGNWLGPIHRGLNDVARAESKGESAMAIDKLDEVAKALLFRAIEIAGDQVRVSAADQARAANNTLDYGSALARQNLIQNWPWVVDFASLHRLRTVHLAPRGAVRAAPDRTPEHLETAYSLFTLGAHDCCELIMMTVTTSQAASG